METCLKCHKNLLFEPTGYNSVKYCSAICQRLYLKSQYRKRNRDKVNSYNRLYKVKHRKPGIIKPKQIRERIEKVYEIPCGFCPNKIFISKRSRIRCPIHRASGSKALRFRILQRDKFTCQYCGRKAPEVILQVDHIIPNSIGGETVSQNLITACWDCNIGKRDKILAT